MTLELTSTAFADGQAIPRQYTTDGGNLSPGGGDFRLSGQTIPCQKDRMARNEPYMAG